MLHCAFYLKQCASSLQKAYGGLPSAHDLLPVPVSLTRSGYPQIIPSFHRQRMYVKDDYSDTLVQIFLSFFSLAKVLLVAKKVSKYTFTSISSPVQDMDSVIELIGKMKSCMSQLVSRYLPRVSRIPLFQGMSWDPTWKALPTHKFLLNSWLNRLKVKGKVSHLR